MSNFEWFIRALGFWYCLTLVVGFGVFAWSCCELLRKVPIRYRGLHGVLLLLPIVAALVGAVVSRVDAYLTVRDLGGGFTGSQIALDFILSTVCSLTWGIFVTFPAFIVLMIGWLWCGRSVSKVDPSTRSSPSP